MTPLTIFLIIASVCIITLLCALLPLIKQLRATAASADTLFKKIDEEFAPMSRSITETSEEINSLLAGINDKIDQTDYVVDQVKEASDIVLHTSHLLQDKIAPLLVNLAGFNAGIQTFMKFFRK